MSPNIGILLKGVLIPKLLNNPLASCSLKSYDCLLLHTAHVNKRIIFPLLVFEIFGFALSVFTLQTI